VGRIRILSDAVANKIAAGEVVERPASVVKELLENSLDAGARTIRIEVEKGGRRLIRITDDGSGMLRDDAMLAFERHATSKLSDVKDLFAISTLGFRGEALPSIAAVSRLILETKSVDETTGTRVEIAGGKLLRCDEAALAQGTTITVRDLFFNVPARKKFLRSEQTELAHIASLATHYSLAHPDKSLQLLHEGKSLLDVTPVDALRERVFQVFGSQTLSDLVELEPHETVLEIPPPYGEAAPEAESRRFSIKGFISQPQVQKLNRNSVYVFVNRRLIRDRMILHAISSAYHNVIPPASYPFALLFLECEFDEVDVNVHPSKTEVRFRHGSFVHDFVRDTLRQELIARRPVSSIPQAAVARPVSRTPGTVPAQAAAALPFSEFSQVIENQGFADLVSEPAAPALQDEVAPEFTLRRPQPPAPRLDFGGSSIPLQEPPSSLKLKVPDTHGPFPPGLLPAETYSLDELVNLRPLGQIHDSFIVAAGNDGLWIIDQHVAHERILFEQVLRQQAAGRVEKQQLLIPIVLELTAGQQVEYDRIAGELHASGFDTEPFGHRAIAVKAAPAVAGTTDFERLIFEILEIGESELRRVSLDNVRRAIAASIACRAAIKINMRLDQIKMAWLLDALAKTEYPMSCPHGRPIALRYATRDILKGFQRL
jgi:DNA mismatch repair protein MutL